MAQALARQPEESEALPKMRELKTHNHLLDDIDALNAAWETDGYWFFKNVLDQDAVGRLRSSFVEELERQGVIDPIGDKPTDRSVRYNGASLDNFPMRMGPLAEHQPWRAFVAEKPIRAFFTRLLGDEPFWVPVVEYRATPPAQESRPSRFDGIHQDGPYSPGIPFRICWIPLAEIDADVGGVVLAEGLTEKVNRHPLEGGSNVSIPPSYLPEDCWRRTTYEAGDVLLMNLWTPHSGIANISDRFRLSLDHRVMARSDKCPVVGRLISITPEEVRIREDGGREVTLGIEPDTYVRNHMGQKMADDELASYFTPGFAVIAAHDGDKATVVRPQH
jgi:ectoine hydroxylase-related dioxygenase (phytanoyl-CoA dioxygenase family)